jgi:Zn-dependent protease with chaperone function
VLPAAVSLLLLLLARQRDGIYDTKKWTRYTRQFRVVPLFVAATWWFLCDTFPQSHLLAILQNFAPRWAYFVSVPVLSIGLARLIVYLSSRKILARRWANIDILRLTTWSTITSTVPLLMVALGVDVLPYQVFAGLSWLAVAVVTVPVATLRLRSAEGFNSRSVNSGELHKRAFAIAKKMGVRLRRVYIVPSGKNHLTNAFAGLSKSIGVSDDYGKWLKGSQLDFVVAHELAHIQQKHGLKKLAILFTLFSIVCSLGIAVPHFPSAVRALFPFLAVFGPMMAFYFLSRCYEYEADRIGVDIADDASAAIQALMRLHRHTQESGQFGRFVELFSTHPALSRRLEAIVCSRQLTTEQRANLTGDNR